MEDIQTVLTIVTSTIVIASFVGGVIMWWRGIIPAVYRLGDGLANRQIAIFAKADMGASLEQLLLDSKLFKKKNILRLQTVGDTGAAEKASVLLVYWHDVKDHIAEILDQKSDGKPLIVYARQEDGMIPQDAMRNLTNKRNVIVTNLRGRLLGDVVTCMITTSR